MIIKFATVRLISMLHNICVCEMSTNIVQDYLNFLKDTLKIRVSDSQQIKKFKKLIQIKNIHNFKIIKIMM